MVIFHSYVSLPEGKWVPQPPWSFGPGSFDGVKIVVLGAIAAMADRVLRIRTVLPGGGFPQEMGGETPSWTIQNGCFFWGPNKRETT